MNMKNSKHFLAFSAIALVSLALQGNAIAQQKNDPKFNKMMKDGFRADGIAGLDRIDQDATQKFCSDPDFANSKQGDVMRDKIQKMNMATIKQPTDGKYIGDWKKGEAIAQSGRGATWTDTASTPIGGGCYNCHQIDKKEISYGSIGPSLWNYGKIRGNSDAVVQYTWNKISSIKFYYLARSRYTYKIFLILYS